MWSRARPVDGARVVDAVPKCVCNLCCACESRLAHVASRGVIKGKAVVFGEQCIAMGRKCRFNSGCSSGTVRVSSENSSTSSASAQQRGYFVVCAVSIMCYANALNGDMVHDDIPAIVRNSDVLGTTSLHQLLKNDFWGYPMHDINSHKSYRPVTTFTFRYFFLTVHSV